MNNAAKSVHTLFNWNILVLPTDEEVFVGLCNRTETLPPFSLPNAADNLLTFILQNSSAIQEFNDSTGVEFDSNGSRYVVLGKPSDPTGMIRFSVSQMMQSDEIRLEV